MDGSITKGGGRVAYKRQFIISRSGFLLHQQRQHLIILLGNVREVRIDNLLMTIDIKLLDENLRSNSIYFSSNESLEEMSHLQGILQTGNI